MTLRSIRHPSVLLLAATAFAATQRCMAKHGYVRFVLTEAQRGEIAQLKEHSQEWRTYLHKLASDGAIVEQQKERLPEG
jgi:hypothetical protein